MTLTLIGYGFVGKAVYNSLNQANNIIVVDPKYNDNQIEDTDGYIICVPTPLSYDGSCNMKYVFDVIEQIPDNKPILIKSTISLEGWNKIKYWYPDKQISFSPEFLVATQANEDFANQTSMLIGGDNYIFWTEVFKKSFPEISFYIDKVETLILTKYARNCFLATKVAFFNDLYKLAEAAGVDYHNLRRLTAMDDRIGPSHTQVPGPDGEFGFGGACFPKDTRALVKTARHYNQNMTVLKSAIRQNSEVRD